MVGDIVIRSAELRDISNILKIQNGLLLKNKTIKVAEKTGFLVYSIKENEVEDVVLSNNLFFIVAECEGAVRGYALAYDLNDWRKIKPKWDKRVLITMQIRNHFVNDKILYLRHVARELDYIDVEEKMEEKIYELARNRGFKYVVVEILERPVLNKKSKEVYEAMGYVKIGQTDYVDGNFWGLYEKELS